MGPTEVNNRSGIVIFLVSMFLSISIIVYFSFVDRGVSSLDRVQQKELKNQGPSGAQVAGSGAFEPSKVKEPWLTTEDLVAHGNKVFQQNCAVCHGSTGLGDGVASKGLNVQNLVKGQWRQGGSSLDLMKTINKGVPETSMAGFNQLPLVDRWALVHFIRSITKNKVKDDMAKLKEMGSKIK